MLFNICLLLRGVGAQVFTSLQCLSVHYFRRSVVQGFNPCLRFPQYVWKPVSMRPRGIFGQGFTEVPGVYTSGGHYPCGLEGFTTYQCSKEQARTAVRLASPSLSFADSVKRQPVDDLPK